MGALPYVLSATSGSNTQTCLEVIDGRIEIGCGVNDVVNEHPALPNVRPQDADVGPPCHA